MVTSTTTTQGKRRRRRFAPLLWLGGFGAVAVLALGVNGSLSTWTASITNADNHVGTGTLVMQEVGPADDAGTGGTTTCLSSDATANCTTINKYGDAGDSVTNLAPGGFVVSTVTISNTGTTDASAFTLAFGSCTQVPTADPVGPPIVGNLCSQLTVDVYQASTATGTPIATGTPTALAAGGATSLTAAAATTAGGAGQDFTFKVTLPSTAGNEFQGIVASQPITWTFTA